MSELFYRDIKDNISYIYKVECKAIHINVATSSLLIDNYSE